MDAVPEERGRGPTSSWSRKRRAPRSTDMSSAEEMVRRRRRGQHARWLSTGWLMWLDPNTTSVVSERSRRSCSVLRAGDGARHTTASAAAGIHC